MIVNARALLLEETRVIEPAVIRLDVEPEVAAVGRSQPLHDRPAPEIGSRVDLRSVRRSQRPVGDDASGVGRGAVPDGRVHTQLDGHEDGDQDDEDPFTNVDYIMRFENLAEDFRTVCGKVGISAATLPRYNRSNREHYSKYYDDELRELVRTQFAAEIERFSYTFEEQ